MIINHNCCIKLVTLVIFIKSTQLGRVKRATLFSYRLKRNNNEVWQQDIKIKIPRTVTIH